ncbi:helix-turn-helix transcriptional regulator [Candidatus Gottesmanbacteria bacterium]|nr:helix-turn-helix transcriptional regulator [Candidatus Gottesmanbacteria bacterium]
MKRVLRFPDVADFKRESLKDPKVKAAYNQLGPRYTLIRQVLEARLQKCMSQKALAAKMRTKQSAIARFESGNTNPTLSFIERLARATKTPLTISISG